MVVSHWNATNNDCVDKKSYEQSFPHVVKELMSHQSVEISNDKQVLVLPTRSSVC